MLHMVDIKYMFLYTATFCTYNDIVYMIVGLMWTLAAFLLERIYPNPNRNWKNILQHSASWSNLIGQLLKFYLIIN